MRALGGSGRGLITVSLLFSTLHVAAADDAHCDPSIPKRDDIPHGYRLRSDRCEGVYAQPASATFAVASFMATPAPGPLEDQTPLTVSWRAVSDAAPRLRARSIRPDLFYQMDTQRPKGTATFTWPTDRVLEHIDRDLDLAVLSIVDTREFNEELDKLPYDRLATDSLKPRDRLYAMGNPEGQAWFSNVSPDRFRGVHNDLLEVESSTIRVGHSGGGLFNDGWLLVGMVSHVDPPVSRAVPIERILNRLRQWNYPVDLRPHRATSAGRPPLAAPSPRTDAPPPAPAPRPAASTGNINLAYAGDQYSCRLLLDVSIGGRSFVPLANFFPVSNVPLGEQPYSISGRIDCPMVGSCIARGNGQVRVEEGSTFSVLWANSSYGTCDVHLLGPGSSLLR